MSGCLSCGCGPETCEGCTAPKQCNNGTCCCPPEHRTWRSGEISRAIAIEYLSTGWMTIEIAGALVVGALAGSFALLAFGGDSVVELISATVILSHMSRHRSGAQTMGRRTAIFTSLLLFSLIPAIGIGATYSLVSGARPESSVWGVAIAVGAVIIMPVLWHKKRDIGRRLACLPFSVDAMESATCFMMAIALLVGLLGSFLFDAWWLDYAATAAILGIVAVEAGKSLAESRKL